MYPAVRDSLSAYPLRPDSSGGVRVAGPLPFLATAAEAMGIDQLRVIDTGLDPVTAEREQWDDGNNTLAVSPGVVVAYERNVETNARLEDAGIEVLRIGGSELGSGRGGPRCMACPIDRAALRGHAHAHGTR
jgi:arginine deiminase